MIRRRHMLFITSSCGIWVISKPTEPLSKACCRKMRLDQNGCETKVLRGPSVDEIQQTPAFRGKYFYRKLLIISSLANQNAHFKCLWDLFYSNLRSLIFKLLNKEDLLWIRPSPSVIDDSTGMWECPCPWLAGFFCGAFPLASTVPFGFSPFSKLISIWLSVKAVFSMPFSSCTKKRNLGDFKLRCMGVDLGGMGGYIPLTF